MAKHLNLYITVRSRPPGDGARAVNSDVPPTVGWSQQPPTGPPRICAPAIATAREAFDTGRWPERERMIEAGGVDTDRVDATSGPIYAPVDVCGLITPWNYFLLQAIWKVAPALLAGDTVALKPREPTPATAALLMRTPEEAGVLAGASAFRSTDSPRS